MRYFLVELKDVGHTRFKALLVVADAAEEALSYVPPESQDSYRVTGQSGKGVHRHHPKKQSVGGLLPHRVWARFTPSV